MSERFTRLFSLPENLYSEGSPVVISAGALLKDTQNGSILAQLKLTNISGLPVVAVKVRLSLFDPAGAKLSETDYQYLDQNARRGQSFGSKAPIMLNQPTTRRFSVCVTEVVLAGGEVWTAPEHADWQTLPALTSLASIDGIELHNQFRLQYGNDCAFVPVCVGDLWYCACGALNRTTEQKCHSCSRSQTEMLSVDMDALKEARDQRLAEEAEEKRRYAEALAKAAEETAARKKAKKRRTKKILSITIPSAIVAVAGVLAALHFIGISSAKKYADSHLFASGRNAIILDFSTQLLEPDLVAYLDAGVLFEQGRYTAASEAFDRISSYKDSAELSLESLYQEGLSAMNQQQYSIAESIFSQLAQNNYKDSSELAEKVTNLKIDAEIAALKESRDYPTLIGYLNQLAKQNRSGAKDQLNGTYFEAADYYYSIGDYQQAYTMIEPLKDTDPDALEMYRKSRIAYANKNIMNGFGLSQNLKIITDLINEGYAPATTALSTAKSNIYAYGRAKYKISDYTNARTAFGLISDYGSSAKYLTLISAQRKQASLKDLWAIRDFEDAGDLLLTEHYLTEFLTGNWKTKDRSYYFEINSDGQSGYNLPWQYSGSYYYIDNGTYSVGNTKSAAKKEFKFTIVDWNTIEVYCYKNKSTYTLYRQ